MSHDHVKHAFIHCKPFQRCHNVRMTAAVWNTKLKFQCHLVCKYVFVVDGNDNLRSAAREQFVD